MKIFLDTAAIDEIRTAASWDVLDGVTTNPSVDRHTQMVHHPLTDAGIRQFRNDWTVAQSASAGKSK